MIMRSNDSECKAESRIGRCCLYCLKDASGATSQDHPLLEALGTSEVLPKGFVCDRCNRYFGKHLDQPLADYLPIAERIVLGRIAGKKGRLRRRLNDRVSVDVSPERIHLEIDQAEIRRSDHDDRALLVFAKPRALDPRVISRALYRASLGVLAACEPIKAFDPRFDDVRTYIREPPYGYVPRRFLESSLLTETPLQELPDALHGKACEVGFCETPYSMLCILDLVNVGFIVPLEWKTPELPPFDRVRLRLAWDDGRLLEAWTLQPSAAA